MPENVGDAGVVVDKRNPADAARQINASVWDEWRRCTARLQANALRRAAWFTDDALTEALRGVLADWATAFDEGFRVPQSAGGGTA